MHEIFIQVLTHKDLSKAGELFNVSDHLIVSDLTDVINKIREIASLPEYTRNDNDQSVVEICITRVTTAIRETGSIEQHAQALVLLLQTCLNHNLHPTNRDQDPPHAKIASDVVSCIFLNYHRREVMALALPVAVKFLHKGNKELSRNMSSYLSLAAIDSADLLAAHIQPIIDSVISGNYSLSRVLPQIYAVKKDPIHNHVMTLVSLLPQCDTNEKLGLLTLFSLVAKNKPSLLEQSLPQLVDCLSLSGTSMATLQIFSELCIWNPAPFTEHLSRLKAIVEQQPHCLPLGLLIISSVGQLSKEKGKAALDYVSLHLHKVESNFLSLVLERVQILCSMYPGLLSEPLLTSVNKCMDRANSAARSYIQQLNNEYNEIRNTNVNHTPGGGTIVRVGGGNRLDSVVSSRPEMTHFTKDFAIFQPQGVGNKFGSKYQKHSDTSRSTGRLVTATNRSMPKLNALPPNTGRLGSSAIQLNKSLTLLNSSNALAINRSVTILAQPTRHKSANVGPVSAYVSSAHVTGSKVISCPPPASRTSISPHPLAMSTANTLNPAKSSSVATLKEEASTSYAVPSLLTYQPLSSESLSPPVVSTPNHISSREFLSSGSKSNNTNISASSVSVNNSSSHMSTQSPIPVASALPAVSLGITSVSVTSPVVTTACSPNPNISSSPNNSTVSNNNSSHRISVFEPIAMRDTVQHFCEKHLDKIKSYMQKVFVRLPLPVRCGIEEKKNRKHTKLYFACQGKGEFCLYSKQLFIMKTRNPRIWIHLMFLALQARASVALSTRETQVSSLKNCWDILRCDNKTFITLVTSAFPSAKDMDLLMHELRNARFFDVFEYNGVQTQWGCFLCNHPERARGFVEEDTPVIEGQLKEKKSKWRIFRKWRTRYFTLSGAQLSYSGSSNEKCGIEVHQIRSVKVRKSGRQIPKAFEIFTDNQTFVLKAKDSSNAEEWVKCLSIVVAHSHTKDTSGSKTSTSVPRNFMYGHHSSSALHSSRTRV